MSAANRSYVVHAHHPTAGVKSSIVTQVRVTTGEDVPTPAEEPVDPPADPPADGEGANA